MCSRRPASPIRSIELALDEAVNVFVGARHERGVALPFFENRFQRRDDRRHIRRVDDARGAERLRPRDASGHVVFEQRAVEAEGDAEVERRRVWRAVEPAGPERHDRGTAA